MLAAEETLQFGFGGISLVSRACGLSRVTITAKKRTEAKLHEPYRSAGS
jgi:hypothetical protein